MDSEMETTSSLYDPEDLSIREQFCRYGKRHGTSAVCPHQESSVSKFSEPILFHDGTRIHSPTNTALILENIKQEVEKAKEFSRAKNKRAELEDLEGAELEEQLLQPTTTAPAAPTQVPAGRQPACPAPQKRTAEEDELAALQAEMAL